MTAATTNPSSRQEPGSRFAVVSAVGPSDREVDRVQDLFDSLEAFEPGNYHFVLIDDSPGTSRFTNIVPKCLRDRYIEIKNPRRGQGCGWAAGCAVAVLAGLNELLRRRIAFTFALKLDTDALVIRPFAEKISRQFAAVSRIGMIGTVRNPELGDQAREAVKPMGRVLDKLSKQFTVWRRTPLGRPAVQIALWGRYRLIRDTIREAFINGFRVGEHCYGGGYALSRPCIEAFAARGLLARPRIWLRTPLVEDLLISLCVKSVDFDLKDLSGKDEPFAIRYLGLPDTPENLVTRGHSIIHSVKDCEAQALTEAELRSFFRDLRTQATLT
ncbi:MAG: hypothetical protein JO015_13970 [Verrucomicrobia bacterium]|nr:hypothetical protein [Verrucomicrobiota bacterium]